MPLLLDDLQQAQTLLLTISTGLDTQADILRNLKESLEVYRQFLIKQMEANRETINRIEVKSE